MHKELFQQFGLAKNEAIIYEILLKEGESSIATITKKSKIHRRNIYDSLRRLMEKGVVFEIISVKENLYQAVNPNKFMEFVREKEIALQKAMPALQTLYKSTPHKSEVYIYSGAEGWKNYMRDMLRVAKEVHFIGARGAWLDERVKNFFPMFAAGAKQQKIKYYHLFDHKVKTQCPEILKYVGKEYKFLPSNYSAPAMIDIFGDYVNIVSNSTIGGLDEEFSFTVIVDKQIADAFRIWFKFMWDFCPK